jgi:pimeloyl-ACP methyl ester carboxylesterase
MFARVRFRQLSFIASLLSVLASSVAFADAPHTDIDFNVSVHGGTGSIHANIYTNPANSGATTILAVHGLTGTGENFGPLSAAIFADSILGRAVKRVIAIDMPGHGESSSPTLPSPARFTDLTIEDNVSVVIQSIDALRSRNLGAQVIMGHSMGGLEVQVAQEALLASGSSLAKHGVFGAILLGAVPNSGSVWTQPPANPNINQLIVTSDTALGPYFNIGLSPLAVQHSGSWTTLDGTLATNAPTVAQITANDWVGIEPLTTLLELAQARPFARRNAFALSNGTVLSVVSFSQDVLSPAVDQDDLYLYLTGVTGPLYRPIVAPDAVHAMLISNPTGLLSALRNGVF